MVFISGVASGAGPQQRVSSRWPAETFSAARAVIGEPRRSRRRGRLLISTNDLRALIADADRVRSVVVAPLTSSLQFRSAQPDFADTLLTYPVVFTFARAGALRLETPVENPQALPPRARETAPVGLAPADAPR
jgi:hypothetical protein